MARARAHPRCTTLDPGVSLTRFCPRAAAVDVTCSTGYATLRRVQLKVSNARYLAAARANCLSADSTRPAGHPASQRRLPLQPIVRALPRQCRAAPQGGDVERSD